eukprot:9490756-Pyramimonas_sp.AAC.1
MSVPQSPVCRQSSDSHQFVDSLTIGAPPTPASRCRSPCAAGHCSPRSGPPRTSPARSGVTIAVGAGRCRERRHTARRLRRCTDGRNPKRL